LFSFIKADEDERELEKFIDQVERNITKEDKSQLSDIERIQNIEPGFLSPRDSNVASVS
jgi:hypothetical protein